MNFSAVPNRFPGQFLRACLKIIPPQSQIRIIQGKLKGYKWIVGSSVHGCWLGSYELEKQLAFQEIIQSGKIIYDLGANVGFYSLLSSVLTGKTGKVIAFEPVPRNLYYLQKHIEINRIKNVQIIDAAVSNESRFVTFDMGPHSSMGKISKDGSLQVRTVVLDSLVDKGEIPSPDYLKIDIEGAEYLALVGAKKILQKYHPLIFLATHGAEVHQNCLRLLESYGYTLRSINEKNLQETDELIAIYQ